MCIVVSVLFTSCFSTKKYAYFQDLSKDSTKKAIVIQQSDFLLKIQQDDVLGIDVLSSNPQAAVPFNINGITSIGGVTSNGTEAIPLQSPAPAATISTTAVGPGYLVDRQGYIEFPILGRLYVVGMTMPELKDTLTSILQKKYIKDALVKVKFMNAGVLIMGEVGHPSRVALEKDKTSIYDALALSGDITVIGNRSDVLLIREVNGVKNVKHLDLTKSDVINSPDYYLRQNDLVYVAPRKEIGVRNDNTTFRLFSYIFSFASLISLIIAIKK